MFRPIQSNSRAVTEIIGTMLLLGISISLFSIVYLSIYSLPEPVSTPSSKIVGLLDEEHHQIVFHHLGGEPISGDGILRVYKGNTLEEKKLSECGVGEEWEIGETIKYNITYLENTFIDALIIDSDSDSIVSNAVLQKGYSAVEPVVETLEAAKVGKYGATLTMTYDFFTSKGNLFFSYRELGSGDPWINTAYSIQKTGYGTYTHLISGLDLSTTYEYKAIMKNETIYIIGSTRTFKTSSISLATWVNNLPDIIDTTSYNITATGDPDLENVTLYYRYSSDDGTTWETSSSDEDWWNTNWKKRKPCTIQGSTSGAVVNYPIPITVHYGSGSDSARNVYLDANAQSDFDDIRFVTPSGLELSYYLEQKINNDKALFWVNIDSIPAYPDNATCYLYYENPSATSTSNGFATFTSFEDFETTPFIFDTDGDGGINLAKEYSNPKQGTFCAKHNDGSQDYRIIMQDDQQYDPKYYEFGGWARINTGWSGNDGLGPGIAMYCDPGKDNGYQIILDIRGAVSPEIRIDTKNSGGNRVDGDYQISENQWYFLCGYRDGNNIKAELYTEDQYYTGVPQTTNQMTSTKYTNQGYHGLFVYGVKYQFWDAIRVRKIVDPEPCIISWNEKIDNGWIQYTVDKHYPWYWDFYFGEHAGLYEFFSVSMYDDSVEIWPESADESCIYTTD